MKRRSSSEKGPKPTVKKKGIQERVTIGMDLGDKTSRYCILSHEGEIRREGQVPTTKTGDGGGVWFFRAGSDRDRSRNPFAVGEPFIAEFGT